MADALEAEAIRVERAGRAVVEGVSLTVPAGAIAAILGPNGAGKSTLLSALAGLLPFEGAVRVGGRDLTEMGRRERARRVGYVPQRSVLTAPLSVREVVIQGRFARHGPLAGPDAEDRRAVETAMARADVSALADRRFDRLSLGERRRALLARALATEAEVLLLDEPTASLDVGHELDLHALLRDLADDGLAVVVVLHGLDAARRHADRALLLDEGREIASGPVAEVVEADAIREVYGVELVEGGGLGFTRSER